MAELAPLLWFDRDRDGKRSLTKVYNPLIASLLTQSNLKSVLLKRMSKFVPKLLIGLATALPNINSDMILLKVKLFLNFTSTVLKDISATTLKFELIEVLFLLIFLYSY